MAWTTDFLFGIQVMAWITDHSNNRLFVRYSGHVLNRKSDLQNVWYSNVFGIPMFGIQATTVVWNSDPTGFLPKITDYFFFISIFQSSFDYWRSFVMNQSEEKIQEVQYSWDLKFDHSKSETFAIGTFWWMHFKYSGNLKSDHLKSGNIWNPVVLRAIFQMVGL